MGLASGGCPMYFGKMLLQTSGVHSADELWANSGPLRRHSRRMQYHQCDAIPTFIHISDEKVHEVNMQDFRPIEAGAF